MRDWLMGTGGKWVSMGIASDGSYGIPKNIMYGFPVTCSGGEYCIVQDLEIDAFSRERMQRSLKELEEEAAAVADLLRG
jgi:malate dehydrogenase